MSINIREVVLFISLRRRVWWWWGKIGTSCLQRTEMSWTPGFDEVHKKAETTDGWNKMQMRSPVATGRTAQGSLGPARLAFPSPARVLLSGGRSGKLAALSKTHYKGTSLLSPSHPSSKDRYEHIEGREEVRRRDYTLYFSHSPQLCSTNQTWKLQTSKKS